MHERQYISTYFFFPLQIKQALGDPPGQWGRLETLDAVSVHASICMTRAFDSHCAWSTTRRQLCVSINADVSRMVVLLTSMRAV